MHLQHDTSTCRMPPQLYDGTVLSRKVVVWPDGRMEFELHGFGTADTTGKMLLKLHEILDLGRESPLNLSCRGCETVGLR